MKQTLATLALALILAVQSCGGDDEATGAQVLEAMCARQDVCRMTSVKNQCPQAYRIGCPDGKAWDSKAAHRCVQALEKADCAQITMSPVPVLPDVCAANCR